MSQAARRAAVPWQDWCEWQQVHAALFADDDDEQQQRALSRVAAWRSRTQLPVAVSSTAQLLELRLHERLARGHHHGVGGASRSHLELSLQYASAVVRCVNGLVDSAQKGAYALAVSSLAQRIGIPLWIVDLRHESTHNQLPSLPVLRFAAQHLLAWLRANYWHKQDELLRAQVRRVGDALSARIAQLLRPHDASVDAEPVAPIAELLDVDKVRNIVVPLFVSGTQYNERMAPTGLLFAFLDQGASTIPTDELATQYPRAALVPLLLEVQSVWRSFSAWLLAHMCRRVFALNSGAAAAARDADADADAAALHETELCLLWVRYLVSNDWRRELKFAAEPVDDLYDAGAEMLCRSEALKPTKRDKAASAPRRAVFERLQTTLRTCKGMRTHAALATDAALRAALNDSAADAATAWHALPGWTGSPLGMRFTYSALDSELEYPLDLDGLNADAFAVGGGSGSGEDEAMADEDEDACGDAAMAELDAAYAQTLAQALELKGAVVQHVVREGQSVHQKLLPQEELQRIQSEIEIW
ncbi:hypothetical protein PybrP1_007672 [[Pythium] brassicae (nom. inval.)]|nr:hypothetical protein PybrP1_007672 [[Pythium] brassicae (nom. inval.)]